MTFQLEDVSFSYKSKVGSARAIFDGLSLAIGSGECVGIIGPEGSGKTTLLQLMDALVKPDRGKVLIDGRNIWQEPRRLHEIRRKVGFAFQFPEQQFFSETVGEELKFALRNFGMWSDSTAHRPEEALLTIGLQPEMFLQRSPFALSIGEARRVALASILTTQPRAILLDEPTVGLDASGVERVIGTLQQLKSKGVTIVIVSHDLDALAEIAERVVVLGKGVEEDAPARILFYDQEKLARCGYDLPEVVRYMRELRAQGQAIPRDVLTMEEARKAIGELTRN
jgi:energy-coupling factor transport system ATP-binding protein